jgi:hypothetical protein
MHDRPITVRPRKTVPSPPPQHFLWKKTMLKRKKTIEQLGSRPRRRLFPRLIGGCTAAMVVWRAEDLVETDMSGSDAAHLLRIRDLALSLSVAVEQGLAFPPSAASW